MEEIIELLQDELKVAKEQVLTSARELKRFQNHADHAQDVLANMNRKVQELERGIQLLQAAPKQEVLEWQGETEP